VDTRNIYKRFCTVLCCLGALNPQLLRASFDYTPDRNSVPLSASVELAGSVGDYVQFLYNRGRGAVSFKDTVLDMLRPESIRGIKGFRSYQSTRLDISVYEFRLLETLKPIETLLKKGMQFRFVADPSTFTPFRALTEIELGALSPEQSENYIKSYDKDGDGIVGESDERFLNQEKFVSIEAFKKLEALRKKYPKQVELINPPNEYVSTSEVLPFPRLHHLKDISIDFFRDGAWRSQVSLRSSANLTDSCMHFRIAQSEGNKQRYVDGNFDGTNYAKGSQGNIQFGAFLKGETILDSIQAVKEEWLALYKKKKHFDEGKLRETILPRIVINDPKGYRSTLQTFYSEGTKAEGRKTVDPVLVAVHHLSDPDKSLRVHYSTQFVSTHTSKNHALRYLIDKAGNKMEDFFMLVDGNFAVEPYSAVPHLAFAPSLSMQYGTLEGKSVRDLPSLPDKLDWENAIGVYEGFKDVYGAPGDKLHAKVDYYEYVTRSGERHYVVVWGSANSSKNSSKGNADALHLLDTTDPSVGKSVKKYFQGIRSDKRIFSYALAYLDRRFRETFHWDQKILNEEFLQKFADYLSGTHSGPKQLKLLIAELGRAKARSEYGANFLKLLRWYSTNVAQDLVWSDFYVLLEISNPKKANPDALAVDLAKRWGLNTKVKFNSLNRTFESLSKTKSFGDVSKNMARILQNCSVYLQRLGVRQNPSTIFAGAE
jgi:hypothetical protein